MKQLKIIELDVTSPAINNSIRVSLYKLGRLLQLLLTDIMKLLQLSAVLFLSSCLANQWDFVCDPSDCHPPECLCARESHPDDLPLEKIPQFVMMSFDAAVNVGNMPLYQELILRSKRKNKNGCSIGATFFVSHEYTDYRLVHRLYMRGNEIGVHSISHTPDVGMWRELSYKQWRAEISGMKTILSVFAKIPMDQIGGVRAPFLQTGGDVFYEMLHDEGYVYDSSAPTFARSRHPLWPYTLDYGYQQDCLIEPCPGDSYKGLWMVPLVNWYGLTNKTTGAENHCALVDGCTPEPTTVNETMEYLWKNFERHYHTNKAPFPIFLREGWLWNKERKEGFIKFVDKLLEMEDVYFVPVRDVIDYLRNPVELSQYEQKCQKYKSSCPNPGFKCVYKAVSRSMGSCIRCPSNYPVVGNPTGQLSS